MGNLIASLTFLILSIFFYTVLELKRTKEIRMKRKEFKKKYKIEIKKIKVLLKKQFKISLFAQFDNRYARLYYIKELKIYMLLDDLENKLDKADIDNIRLFNFL